MTYQLYRLKFDQAHFGERLLEISQETFASHRLFSALYLEAMAIGRADEFFEACSADRILISDGLFYYFGLYLPKPIGYPKLKEQRQPLTIQQRERNKKAKNIKFIHAYEFDDFVSASIDDLSPISEDQSQLYQFDTRIRLGTDPYRLGLTHYDEAEIAVVGSKSVLLEELLKSLQYSGLGGQKSTGLGQFELSIEPLEEMIEERIKTKSNQPVMLLSSSLPIDEELEESLDGAKYLLEKSSGYAYSEALEESYRKQDLYKFARGSTFERSFKGSIIDVAPENFPHPVWNYAKPLFFELEV